jgi:glycosyltransferase involved in cell wall biosynthesis/O-antigen/teichoic acid export membrane protein
MKAKAKGEQSAADMPLVSGAALIFVARAFEYLMAGISGVILARGLGPGGRGVYGLTNETALLFSTLAALAIAQSSVYLAGQRRFRLETLLSNALTWILAFSAVCAALITAILITDVSLIGMAAPELSIAFAGAALMMVSTTASFFLLAQGRIEARTAISVLEPFLRMLGVLGALALVGLTVMGAISAWLAAILVTAAVCLFLLGKQVRIRPGVHLGALGQQLSFGVRGHLGWAFQTVNHRLDVFLVSYFLGTSAVGQYSVGFNLAEVSWWIPLSLGVVLLPKASTMDAAANAQMSAAVCRRTLVVTLVAILGLVAIAQPLVTILFGSEFRDSLVPLYILAPSGLFYAVHKVLSTSLFAQGLPQASLYGGLASVPVLIGLDLIMIPRFGIGGAAVVSDIAYGVNAAVMLVLFLRASRLPVREVLLFNRSDLSVFRSTLETAIRSLRGPRARTVAREPAVSRIEKGRPAPKVSIVIPTYNMAKYLPLALDSALSQDYPNLEIIVIDDGSTDDTFEMIRHYLPRIRCIRQENQGLPAARNHGLEAAQGEFVRFLDADDALCADSLVQQVEILRRHPKVGLVHSEALVMDSDGNLHGSRRSGIRVSASTIVPSARAFRRLLRGCDICVSTVMARMAAIRRVGPFQHESLPGEDWDMWLRIASYYDNAYVPKPLAYYRVHQGSITANYTLPSFLRSHLYTLRSLFARPDLPYPGEEKLAHACLDNNTARLAARLRQRGPFARYLARALWNQPRLLVEGGTWNTVYEGVKAFSPLYFLRAMQMARKTVTRRRRALIGADRGFTEPPRAASPEAVETCVRSDGKQGEAATPGAGV